MEGIAAKLFTFAILAITFRKRKTEFYLLNEIEIKTILGIIIAETKPKFNFLLTKFNQHKMVANIHKSIYKRSKTIKI